ncbi:MAG: hypothetical protein AB1512_05235 [Thermodesulfobacteriota bacterium]
MKFISYDSKRKVELETEIRSAELTSIQLFVQTWVPDYLMRALRDVDFSYPLFQWEEILKRSFMVGSPWRCFGAFTEKRLDGLLCLAIHEGNLKIEFVATAPWNYSPEGKMRRIGTGMIM